MKTVLIRVTPEIKQVLDNMKAGKKVEGKGYYKRDMKYDDVISILLKYRSDSKLLTIIANMLVDQQHAVWSSDLECVEKSFVEYKKCFY